MYVIQDTIIVTVSILSNFNEISQLLADIKQKLRD